MSTPPKPGRSYHLWNPHSADPHHLKLTHPAQELQSTSSHPQTAVLYKMWSFGPSQQVGMQRRSSLMRAMPINRGPLLALRRKPNLSKRSTGNAIASINFDDEQQDNSSLNTDYKLEKPALAGDSFHSGQEQQEQGKREGHPDEESTPLTVGPTRLHLAMIEPKTTFAMLVPHEDLPKFQHAADVLAYFTQAMLRLRDKGARSQTDLKLRPLTQELILCLLSNLVSYGTLPMTKLDAVRQYLIEAAQEHEKNSQGQNQGEQEKEKEPEKEEKENKKQPAISLPQSVQNLNLLMPVILLSSQRPSTTQQLKLACGRVKTLIRTATK